MKLINFTMSHYVEVGNLSGVNNLKFFENLGDHKWKLFEKWKIYLNFILFYFANCKDTYVHFSRAVKKHASEFFRMSLKGYFLNAEFPKSKNQNKKMIFHNDKSN